MLFPFSFFFNALKPKTIIGIAKKNRNESLRRKPSVPWIADIGKELIEIGCVDGSFTGSVPGWLNSWLAEWLELWATVTECETE